MFSLAARLRPRNEKKPELSLMHAANEICGADMLRNFSVDYRRCQVNRSTRDLRAVLEPDRAHLGYSTSGTSIFSSSFLHEGKRAFQEGGERC